MGRRFVAFVLVAAFSLGGCIRSYCFRDEDCGGDLVCREQDGTCVPPECRVDHPDCPRGEVCEERFCVVGCADDDDCDDGRRCIDRRCMTVGAECDCPLAAEFCGTDLNPNSATAGREVCVPDSFEDGVAIFFGSVLCGHCTADFEALRRRRAQLAAEGLDARLMWIQLKSVPVAPARVAERLGPEADEPVIQDTDEAGLWALYGATWYDLVLVDAHGCFQRKFESLDASEIDSAVGDEIVAAWRDAMDEECPAAAAGGDADGDGGDAP